MAEAEASDDAATRDRLRTEAEQAKALAQALDARAAELAIADEARAVWWAHTAETRAAAERAEAELETRGIDNSADGPTPQEWLDIDAIEAAEDEHREVIDEHELTDVAQQRDADTIEADPGGDFVEAELVNDQIASSIEAAPHEAADEIPHAEIVADDNNTAHDSSDLAEEQATVQESQAPADIREVAASEERVAESDSPRVPSADETAEAVRRAQRALIEIQHRRAAEERHDAAEAEARAEELARWHANDTTEQATTATVSATDQVAGDHGPVMELGRYDDE
jgi:hypothetical protein